MTKIKRKKTRIREVVSIIVAASVFLCAVEAGAVGQLDDTPIFSAKKGKSLPANPQEVWQRIQLLIREHRGYVTKKNVENILLGAKFTFTEKDGEKRRLGAQYFHIYERESTGLGTFQVSLFDDPKHSKLSVMWSPPYCLDLLEASRDLAREDWIGDSRRNYPGQVNLFFIRAEDLTAVKATGNRNLIDPVYGGSAIHLTTSHPFTYLPEDSTACITGFGASVANPNL